MSIDHAAPADHRRLGRELDIFDSDPLIGAGLPFWLPAGAAARHEVEQYLRELERRAGYQHVYSPPLGKRQMFELSGHWDKFADDMYPPMRFGEEELVLRPSLCPHHALIFKARQRSYRDLPLRLAELGGMYRAERSGVVGGLSRVRSIWLNDAHIFCPPDGVGAEVADVLRLMRQAHRALGLPVSGYRLSLRSAAGGRYAGSDASWEHAGRLLREALEAQGIAYEAVPGEAAFYGPKIDVQCADPGGREFTLATVQVDFHQPAQFGLGYRDADGGLSRPVMVHRSLAGSMERLFAVLLEVHGGAFPVWYAPVQASVLPIGDGQRAAAESFRRAALESGLRAEVAADGSLGARVRESARRRIPYAVVIGEREAAAGEVALRLRDGRRLPSMPAGAALALIGRVVSERSAQLLPASPEPAPPASPEPAPPA